MGLEQRSKGGEGVGGKEDKAWEERRTRRGRKGSGFSTERRVLFTISNI